MRLYTFTFRNSIDANRFDSVIIAVLGSFQRCQCHFSFQRNRCEVVILIQFSTLLSVLSSNILSAPSYTSTSNLIPTKKSVNRTMKKPPIIYLDEIVCFSVCSFAFVHSPLRFISYSCAFITVLVTIFSFIYFFSFTSIVVVCRNCVAISFGGALLSN